MHTVNGTVYSFPLSRHVLRFQKERPAFALPQSLMKQTMTFAVVLALSASSFGITYGSGGVNAYFSDN